MNISVFIWKNKQVFNTIIRYKLNYFLYLQIVIHCVNKKGKSINLYLQIHYLERFIEITYNK